jgi:hypothetical protein
LCHTAILILAPTAADFHSAIEIGRNRLGTAALISFFITWISALMRSLDNRVTNSVLQRTVSASVSRGCILSSLGKPYSWTIIGGKMSSKTPHSASSLECHINRVGDQELLFLLISKTKRLLTAFI